MSRGSYDTRAPSASSQIITLERLLEEAEERNAELESTIDKLKEGVAEAAETLNDMLHQPVSDFSDIDDVIFDLEGISGTQPTLVLEKTDG